MSSDGIRRRDLAKAAAWSAPVIAMSAAAPAMAASVTPNPQIQGSERYFYDWGTTGIAGSTAQQLTLAGSLWVSGLPQDAVITGLSISYWIQQRDDGAANGSRGPGAYDPGNRNASITSGSCSTSYSTISGCRWTYPSGSMLAAPILPGTTADNPWTGGTARTALTQNWQMHTFANSQATTARAFQMTFTGDPTIANRVMRTDAKGLKTLFANGDGTPSGIRSTPVFTLNYPSVPSPQTNAQKIILADMTVTLVYTSGGTSRTLTTTRSVGNACRADNLSGPAVNIC